MTPVTTRSASSRTDPLGHVAPAGSADVDRSALTDRLRAAGRGDEQAFREVYRAVQPGLVRYLRVLVADEADDVASETWLQIVRDLDSFRGDIDDFRAWSASVARHRALDHIRARKRRPHTLVPVDDIDSLDARSVDTDAATIALETLSTHRAIALIATLPRDQAEAILLRVVVGLDANATGRVLGKRPGAVRTASHRGLRRLAAMLRPPADNAAEPADSAADVMVRSEPALDGG